MSLPTPAPSPPASPNLAARNGLEPAPLLTPDLELTAPPLFQLLRETGAGGTAVQVGSETSAPDAYAEMVAAAKLAAGGSSFDTDADEDVVNDNGFEHIDMSRLGLEAMPSHTSAAGDASRVLADHVHPTPHAVNGPPRPGHMLEHSAATSSISRDASAMAVAFAPSSATDVSVATALTSDTAADYLFPVIPSIEGYRQQPTEAFGVVPGFAFGAPPLLPLVEPQTVIAPGFSFGVPAPAFIAPETDAGIVPGFAFGAPPQLQQQQPEPATRIAPGFTFGTCHSASSATTQPETASTSSRSSSRRPQDALRLSPPPPFSFGTCPPDPTQFSFGQTAPTLPQQPLVSTPAAELGPFEYPVAVAATVATPSPRDGSRERERDLRRAVSGSVLGNNTPYIPLRTSRSPGTSAGTGRASTHSSPATTPPVTASGAHPFFPRSPPMGRRGSIALGQISRLARNLPGPPKPSVAPPIARRPGHTPSSSIASNSAVAVPTPASPSIGSYVCPSGSYSSVSPVMTAPSPLALRPQHGRRSSSSSSLPTSSPNPSLPLPLAVASLPGVTTPGATPVNISGPIYLPPRATVGGPLAFAHAPLPAPIPPSLLARRGSVPLNAFVGLPAPQGGWNPQVSKLYHQPQRRGVSAPRPRRWSGKEDSHPALVSSVGSSSSVTSLATPLTTPTTDTERRSFWPLAPVPGSGSALAVGPIVDKALGTTPTPTGRSDVDAVEQLVTNPRGPGAYRRLISAPIPLSTVPSCDGL
ncbi:uncharacterized protein EHS24_007409 [Apiotrichum porosum]|uniref:Uncharacterized protein n=1 Tax=Apiotrichum porosum TaxID=105984 RepID=A0A427XUB8_9TREE|nr:uncharacterized protein EHS24_007409 [Apiotrichum porosum]RSH82440.1 hypothetical protein EHS24_007409 [Apiotrichum porosum]